MFLCHKNSNKKKNNFAIKKDFFYEKPFLTLSTHHYSRPKQCVRMAEKLVW